MTLTQTQNLKLNWTRQKQNFCLLTRNYLDTRYKINQNCETMVERRKKSRNRTLNHYSAPLQTSLLVQSRPRNFGSCCYSTDVSCKTGFMYFKPHIGIFDMDVNLSMKNVTGDILIFIVRDRISATKILNVSHNDNKA
jgi:hypothetical protein